MSWDRRVGSGILGGLGFALAILMLYVLLLEHLGDWLKVDPRQVEADEIAVFLLERSEWRIFREGLKAALAESKGLGRTIAEEDDLLLVETAKSHRLVRFLWQNARGEGETQAEARKAATGLHPPLAVIGSSNTVLTEALAERLATDFSKGRSPGPILLVPWATSVRLLDFYPERTFRFCSNNRRAAERLVAFGLEEAKARPPGRVTILVDPRDPYSLDLARCFREEVLRQAPKANVTDRPDVLSASIRRRISGNSETPTPAEQELARAVWADAVDSPSTSTWLMLPLQNEPARRMIAALNATAPSHDLARRAGLMVVCGDSVGLTTLESYVNLLAFPILGLSSVSHPASGPPLDLRDDIQVPAEIAASLLRIVDSSEPMTAERLRQGFQSLKIEANDPIAFGRPIAFLKSGERSWVSEETILILQPGQPSVSIRTKGQPATGSKAHPVERPSVARTR